MLENLSHALNNQCDFRQITFIGENMNWDDINFELNVDYIDRLYYLSKPHEELDEDPEEKDFFHVICRMVYYTEPVFVEFIARCCPGGHGFECAGLGYKFVTKNPNILFRVFLAHLHKDDYDRDSILNSLTL